MAETRVNALGKAKAQPRVYGGGWMVETGHVDK